ncbi:MAG: penicillin-binding protein 2, partial [Actinobacteria bacterium]|nr:penicillin-binding protein 2 [Actinomycetota bacterium]
MVSLPGYDPRPFAEGISQQKLDEYLEVGVPEQQQRFPLMNRCMANAFPPGSTIKTFMAAAGLQEGRITPGTKTKCLGHIAVPWTWNELVRDQYWCWTRDASHGDQDVRLALADSCDVFFY